MHISAVAVVTCRAPKNTLSLEEIASANALVPEISQTCATSLRSDSPPRARRA